MEATTIYRQRRAQAVLLTATIAAGLASREYADALPTVLSRYAGDTLWATAVFLAAGFLWPRAGAARLALGAGAVSLAVELSQLAHPSWLETLRRWPGVGRVLGYDFVPSDLACYGLGVVLGLALDRVHHLRGRARVGALDPKMPEMRGRS